MKKTLALILAAALCAASLCSCAFITFGGDGDAPDTEPAVTAALPDGLERVEYDPAPSVAAARERVNSLPGHKFAKDSFSVAVAPGTSFAPDVELDGYDEALNTRNAIVEKRYGVNCGEFETPLDVMLSDSYSAYLAGLYYADAMLIPQSALGPFAEKGFLLNVYSLPYIDYSREWYFASDVAQGAAGSGAYAVAGTLTDDPSCYYCLYVNDALAGKLGLAIPYDSVREGKWTWDVLLDLTRSGAGIDGGVRVIGAGSASGLVCTVCKSAGGYFMDTGLGKTPAVGFDNGSFAAAFEVLRTLRKGDLAVFDNGETGSAFDAFKGERVLFYADTVGNMTRVSSMGADWRVMPVPKLNAEQDDCVAYLSPDAPVLVTDAGNPHPEDTAYALDALFAATGEYVKAGYSDRLVRTAVNGSAVLDMLDYVYGIKGGRAVYDFCDMYGATYPALKSAVSEGIWEAAGGDGTISDVAASASYTLNWQMARAFPEIKR